MASAAPVRIAAFSGERPLSTSQAACRRKRRANDSALLATQLGRELVEHVRHAVSSRPRGGPRLRGPAKQLVARVGEDLREAVIGVHVTELLIGGAPCVRSLGATGGSGRLAGRPPG